MYSLDGIYVVGGGVDHRVLYYLTNRFRPSWKVHGAVNLGRVSSVLSAALEALLPCPGRQEIYLERLCVSTSTYPNLCSNPLELLLRTSERCRSFHSRTHSACSLKGSFKCENSVIVQTPPARNHPSPGLVAF